MVPRALALVLLVVQACGSPPEPQPFASAAPLPTKAESADAAAPVAPTATGAPPEPVAPVASLPAPPFPPPTVDPIEPRTAREGDGVWSALGDASAGSARLYRTTLHPNPSNPQVYVVVVAIDLDRVSVRLVAGTREPPSDAVPADRRTGLVPSPDQAKLLAVFNGGFLVHHGAWGVVIGKDTLVPPKPDECSVVLSFRRVEIRTQAALTTPPEDRLALRQTPPCLVEQSAINPTLLGPDKPRAWGMSESGGVDIRRSALGVAAGGRTLLYGFGESVTPRQMAESMKRAGALDAAELDVNWSYTRFLLYGPAPRGGGPEVFATLVPKMKHAPGQYVKRGSERDFFYLTRSD